MIDLMKKTLLTGVGLAALTADKVEELAREFVKSAQLSSEKGQEFIKEVTQRAEKARTDLEATVRRVVNDSLRKTDLATHDDVSRLEARIAELERKLNAKSQ